MTGLLKITSLISLLVISGCSTHSRVTAVYDFQNEVKGGNPVTQLQIFKEFHFCEYGYFHQSHIKAGRPFNKREEDIIDGLYTACRIW